MISEWNVKKLEEREDLENSRRLIKWEGYPYNNQTSPFEKFYNNYFILNRNVKLVKTCENDQKKKKMRTPEQKSRGWKIDYNWLYGL